MGRTIRACRRAPQEPGAGCPGAGCRGAGSHGANQLAAFRMAEITRPRGTSVERGSPGRIGAAPQPRSGPRPLPGPGSRLKTPLIQQAPVIKSNPAASVAKRLRQRLVVPPYGGSIPLARPVATTLHPWFVHGVVFCWRRAPAGLNREGGDSALRQRAPTARAGSAGLSPRRRPSPAAGRPAGTHRHPAPDRDRADP